MTTTNLNRAQYEAEVSDLSAKLQALISKVPPCVVNGSIQEVDIWRKRVKAAQQLIKGSGDSGNAAHFYRILAGISPDGGGEMKKIFSAATPAVTLSSEWARLEKTALPLDLPQDQRLLVRRAFFAGVTKVLQVIDGDTANEEIVMALIQWKNECTVFWIDECLNQDGEQRH